MENIKKKHIYIIGIGGKGLNSIAEFCMSKGCIVSGSDIKISPETESLIKKGAHVYVDQSGKHITPDIDIVIYSSIIKDSHLEIKKATQLNLLLMNRARFLGLLTSQYSRVSIAGSHGKSTTSALATLGLKAVLGSINSITGSYIKELQSYQCSGESSLCVLEACEYSKSFLEIPGDYTLITSLEKSHMEYFKTEESMNDAFQEFIQKHKKDSTLIINGDTLKLRELADSCPGSVITCGFNQSNDYVIKNIKLNNTNSIFSIFKDGVCIEKDVEIKIPGSYNILNSALVFVLLHQMNLKTISYRNILKTFTGVGRRFEIEYFDQTVFVDDFAHHPTQVKNLIQSLRQFFPDRKICAIFEPRQHHLIKTFLKEYGKSFKLADEVCITDVVPALGDTIDDINDLSVLDVIENIQRYSRPKKIWYAQSYDHIVEKLALNNLNNTVIATIGAGSISRVRDLLTNRVQ